VIPGYIVQEKYKSCVPFGLPLELRVTALWGKARVGVWWWGEIAPQRTLWLLRRHDQGALSELDDWEVLHEHPGRNAGFAAAVSLFAKHMKGMAATTEHLATAFGAPFLRVDFFVGSSEAGVRLNEVAYGSGIEYRRRDPVTGGLLNDAGVMAQILQEGMSQCTKRFPAEDFLGRVGVRGPTYTEAVVEDVMLPFRCPPPPHALRLEPDPDCARWAVPEEGCHTPRRQRAPMAPPREASASPHQASKKRHGWISRSIPSWVSELHGALLRKNG